jgi:hypothetical protein
MPTYYSENFDLSSKPQTSHLLLAEGESEVGFIDAYLNLLNADLAKTTILCFKGLSKVHGHSNTLAKLLAKEFDGLARLRGIGLMADSEKNPTGQIDLVIECAKAFGFPRCAKDLRANFQHEDSGRGFSFALSPSSKKHGRIETLILQEIGPTALFARVAKSFPCIVETTTVMVDEKAQVQMFISAKANNSMAGIRHAFAAGLFDVRAKPYEQARAMIDYVLARA